MPFNSEKQRKAYFASLNSKRNTYVWQGAGKASTLSVTELNRRLDDLKTKKGHGAELLRGIYKAELRKRVNKMGKAYYEVRYGHVI